MPVLLPQLLASLPVPFWDANPAAYEQTDPKTWSPWNVLFLDGIRVPGRADVKCIPNLAIDAGKAHGRDGGSMTVRGHNPARVEISVLIWTQDQWSAFLDLLSKIWRLPNKQSRRGAIRKDDEDPNREYAIAINHPSCMMFKVWSIIIQSLESPNQEGPGMMRFPIHALQYIPQVTGGVKATRKVTSPRALLKPEIHDSKNAAGPDPKLTDNVPELSTPAQPFSSLTR